MPRTVWIILFFPPIWKKEEEGNDSRQTSARVISCHKENKGYYRTTRGSNALKGHGDSFDLSNLSISIVSGQARRSPAP